MTSELMAASDDEKLEYRRALVDEVRSHRWFSRITLLRATGLMIGGMIIVNYYPPLGWLLVIGGLLQVLNTIYDLQREDKLQKRLMDIQQKFGTPTQNRK